MDRDVLIAIRNLLSSTRVLSLAVLVDGDAEAALLPFALSPGLDAAYVQASALARHSRGLMPGAKVGLLIHAPDGSDRDAMQLPRLMVQATVRILERETDEFATAAARFIDRFPGAKMTLNLGDFTLYELALGRGRYVEGFARALNVGPETFNEVASL
jgi:putative heme iron utilization protein